MTCGRDQIPAALNLSPKRGPLGSELQGTERGSLSIRLDGWSGLTQNQATSRCKHWLGVHCLCQALHSQTPRAWSEGKETHHVSRSILNSDPRMAVIAHHDLIGGYPVAPKKKQNTIGTTHLKMFPSSMQQ